MEKQVVIRRSFLGNLVAVLGISAFTIIGLFMLQDDDAFYRLIGVLNIVFFGGGGLLYLILMMWKPIVIVSNEGITVPYGWGKNFIPWDNIDRFEVLEHMINAKLGKPTKQKYVGVFVFDKEGIAGTGKGLLKISQGLTGWKEVPAVLINLTLSFVKIEKVMATLQEFHDEYKTTNHTK